MSFVRKTTFFAAAMRRPGFFAEVLTEVLLSQEHSIRRGKNSRARTSLLAIIERAKKRRANVAKN